VDVGAEYETDSHLRNDVLRLVRYPKRDRLFQHTNAVGAPLLIGYSGTFPSQATHGDDHRRRTRHPQPVLSLHVPAPLTHSSHPTTEPAL
jgi:hypothetical protein